MKKILVICLCLMMSLTVCAPAFAFGSEVVSFAVNPYGGGADAIDTFSWFAKDGAYYLFLPADTDLNTAKVWFDASGAVTLDGEALANGDPAGALTSGAHTLACGGKTYPLTVVKSENVPAVFIATESGSLDYIHQNKDNKEPGAIRIYEDGALTLDKDLKQIKGRGNATWSYAKKPYNIKFDKKTAVLGMAKAKKWTLLANYHDPSLLRNVYGWELANAFGLRYSSDYRHVDLYVNGEYLGNYVICESVEIGSDRVDIRDLADANEDANPGVDLESLPQAGTGANGAVPGGTVKNSAKWIEIPASPENIEGGYLLEYEIAYRYDAELCGFVTETGQPFVIKEPELASEAEVCYISAIVNDAMNAIYAETGYNDKGKHYSEYFDMDSFVNMYILEEISNNIDAGYTSQYLYKAENSDKLVFSPIWDLDHALGYEATRFAVNIGDPSVWWANSIGFDKPLVFGAVYRHADFRALVTERWQQIAAGALIENELTEAHALSETLAASGVMNILRWNSPKTIDAAQAQYASEVQKGERFISTRRTWLSKGFAADAALIRYDPNGGTGYIFHPEILSVGDTATLIGIDRGEDKFKAPGGLVFAGWNTRPDGSGDTYQPGGAFVVTESVNTLYAQWRDPNAPDSSDPSDTPDAPGQEQTSSFLQKLVAFFNRILAFFRGLFGI